MFIEYLSDEEKKNFAKVAEQLILADGKIAIQEKDYIEQLKAVLGIDNYEIPIENALSYLSKLDNSKKRSIFLEFLIIARFDHSYVKEEDDFLRTVYEAFGFPIDLVKKSEKWAEDYISILETGEKLIEGEE